MEEQSRTVNTITEQQKQQIEGLVQELNEASRVYYNGQEEIMPNYRWDELFDQLKALEEETGYVLPDSPTVSTGYEEDNSGEKENHEYPALSLAKTKSVEELKQWAGDREVWLSWKLDGLTLVLTYDNGKLTKILTRGNGTTGTNITFLKDSLFGFPDTISYKGHLVVRGEATISYKDFAALNDMIEDDDEKYANPRNLASGTLNLDDPAEVKNRHVCFYAFTLVHMDEELVSWGERMAFLEEQGFAVVDHEKVNADTLPEAIDRWTVDVETGKMDVPVDGLVICYEDTQYAAGGSVTGHHATRAGFAFKWQDESVETKLSYVEWSCAVSTISPVAVFEPVQLEGTTVSRASLCNLSEMERLGIGEESTLEVIKANKIIPKCISARDAKGELQIPKECPVCHAPTEIRVSEKSHTKTLHCTNPSCAAKHVRKFTRFVSKNAMDIDGLSVQTVVKFINDGFIRRYGDIYRLEEHLEEIKQMEGFGEKSALNLKNAIDSRREISPIRLLYGLCIPMIGLDVAKKLLNTLGWEEFYHRLRNKTSFEDVDGIGVEKSNSILNWYGEEEHAKELEYLLEQVTLLPLERAATEGGSCKGLTFVITGDVHYYKNRDAFKEYVEAQGGKVAGSVSKKTSYLVNNDVESQSSKNKKAKELSVPIISEDRFVEMFVKE